MTLRIAWFATAKGTSSRLLLASTQAAIAAGRLDAEIVVVFCNRERGQSSNTDAFLDDVEAAEVPLLMMSSGAWRKRVGGDLSPPGGALAPWRRDFDQAVADSIAPFRPEVGVLAGYMLVTTEALCEALPLLNLHPAAPGGAVGTWQEVIRALIADRAERSGMMLQRVTTKLDRGPIVSFCTYAIRGEGDGLDTLWEGTPDAGVESDLSRAIRAEGVRREPGFIVASLQAIASTSAPLPGADDPGPRIDVTAVVEAGLRSDD